MPKSLILWAHVDTPKS